MNKGYWGSKWGLDGHAPETWPLAEYLALASIFPPSDS